MDQIEKVLPAALSQLRLDRRLREHALMQVWSSLLPESISSRSRPLLIDQQHNLVIGVSDASVAQELSLMKSKLMKALAATARSLDIEISSLRLDMKNYHRPAEEEIVEEPALAQVTEQALSGLTLSHHDMQLICNLSGNLACRPTGKEELNIMVLRAYERQLRLAEWRRRHGYPVCQSCKNPVSRLFQRGSHKVCFNCRVEE